MNPTVPDGPDTELAAVIPCRNVNEPDGDRCTGRAFFKPGAVCGRCDTCNAQHSPADRRADREELVAAIARMRCTGVPDGWLAASGQARTDAATIVRAVLARPAAAEGRTFRVGDVVRVVRVVRRGNVTPPNLVGRTGTVVHVGVATANVDLAGPDGGVQVLAQDELRHTSPAAGRDLTGDDVRTAFETWEKSGDGFGEHAGAYVAELLNAIARPAVARTDGQPPADEPRPSRWLVKDGPDSILGSFATRSAAEEAQERVRPAYPTAWVEEYPARSAAPADDTAAPDLPTLRCDRCDATAGPGYPPMGEPFVYFVRPGLCHPCSLAAGQPVRDSQPG